MSSPRCVALVAIGLLASGCPRAPSRTTDGANDAASMPTAAASDRAAASDASVEDAAIEAAAAVPVPMLGWVHPARRVVFPEEPRTSREAFLAAHGVAKDKPDAACWTRGTQRCMCGATFTLTTGSSTTDVLVCVRAVEPPGSAVLPGIGRRSVFYAADKGALKVLLDVPTHATFDPENREGGVVGSVGLRAVAKPNGLDLVDEFETDEGPWCPEAVKRAAAQKGQDWALVHRNYATVCAAAGHYVLDSGGRLVRGG